MHCKPFKAWYNRREHGSNRIFTYGKRGKRVATGLLQLGNWLLLIGAVLFIVAAFKAFRAGRQSARRRLLCRQTRCAEPYSPLGFSGHTDFCGDRCAGGLSIQSASAFSHCQRFNANAAGHCHPQPDAGHLYVNTSTNRNFQPDAASNFYTIARSNADSDLTTQPARRLTDSGAPGRDCCHRTPGWSLPHWPQSLTAKARPPIRDWLSPPARVPCACSFKRPTSITVSRGACCATRATVRLIV